LALALELGVPFMCVTGIGSKLDLKKEKKQVSIFLMYKHEFDMGYLELANWNLI
jgi:hypothetical protein